MRPDADPTSDVPGMAIWGWMSQPELRWLMSQVEGQRVVEVGSLHGRSAYAMASARPERLVCVDPWDDPKGEALRNFQRDVASRFDCVHPYQATSVEAAADYERTYGPLSADVVFLDGAHAYESVLTDVCAWLPLTTRLICGHDYQNEDGGYPGVARAVHEVFGGRHFNPPETAIWAVDLSADRTVEAGLPTGPITWTDEYGKTSTYELTW